jgi:hypothetical protein
MGPKRLMASRMMASLPPPAPSRDWLAKPLADADGNLGVALNDQLGDCTCAATAHATQIWSANTGTMGSPPDSAVLAAYESVCGYVPGNAATDQGGVETTVLAAWQAGLPGISKIDAWIPVNPANVDHMRKAIERFGLLYVGLALPNTIQDQPTVWTVELGAGADAGAGTLGGHAVVVAAYDETSFDICTWGYRVKMSADFVAAYMDEAYAPLCGALWCPTGVSPLGDPPDVLNADLAQVG